MAFQQVTIDVSKKVNGAFQKVGEQNIFVPLLADAMKYVGASIKKDEKGNDIIEDGIPVYDSDEANWIQGAILAAVKAQARNKMVSGTANLKEGQKIATDWAELCAEGVRDGSGLALAREFKASFADWIAKQGLSEAAANMLVTLVSNKAALQLQTQATKDKVKARLEKFADEQNAETVEKFMRPLQSAIDACSATDDPLADL